MDQETIDNALSAAMDKLPDSPRIVRLEGEPYVDTDGDLSLKILVIFSADTTDKQFESSPIWEIKETIRSSLAQHGLREFPYFFFAREDEVNVDTGVT